MSSGLKMLSGVTDPVIGQGGSGGSGGSLAGTTADTTAVTTISASTAMAVPLAAAPAVLSTEEEEMEELKTLKSRVGGGRICCPKGMRDLTPEQMQIRESAVAIIKSLYQRFGAVQIRTPALERLEILLGQYGDGGKLIYRLREETETGEKLAMRYDLTVPLARYMVQHGLTNIKRFHIDTVWRRDQPQMNSGRYREFTQCDFDIAGKHGAPRVCDAECLQLMRLVLTELDIGSFVIKVNNRKILDGLIGICGIPESDFRRTCTIVDELDKVSWEDATKKLAALGHTQQMITTLGSYVNLRGEPMQIVAKLEADPKFMANDKARIGLSELKEMFALTGAMGANSVLSFDLSLARGLGYYTGLIMEAFLVDPNAAPAAAGESAAATKSKKKQKQKVSDNKSDTKTDSKSDGESGVGGAVDEWAGVGEVEDVPTGAIGGGGRYDNLVGDIKHRFTAGADASAAAAAADSVDAVGFSIGIERIFAILEKRAKRTGLNRPNCTMAYVVSSGLGKTDLTERLKLVTELRAGGIATEFSYETEPKMGKQLSKANDGRVPFAVIIGPSELKTNRVTIKVMNQGSGHTNTTTSQSGGSGGSDTPSLANMAMAESSIASANSVQSKRAGEYVVNRSDVVTVLKRLAGDTKNLM